MCKDGWPVFVDGVQGREKGAGCMADQVTYVNGSFSVLLCAIYVLRVFQTGIFSNVIERHCSIIAFLQLLLTSHRALRFSSTVFFSSLLLLCSRDTPFSPISPIIIPRIQQLTAKNANPATKRPGMNVLLPRNSS